MGERLDGANCLLGEAFCIFGAEKERKKRLHVLVKRGVPSLTKTGKLEKEKRRSILFWLVHGG